MTLAVSCLCGTFGCNGEKCNPLCHEIARLKKEGKETVNWKRDVEEAEDTKDLYHAGLRASNRADDLELENATLKVVLRQIQSYADQIPECGPIRAILKETKL